jgi:hypothetical protein
MTRFSFRAVAVGCGLLAACVSDPIAVHPQDVGSIDTLDEHLEASETGCHAENLRVSYVDDDGDDRGRLRVAFDGSADAAATVYVEVQGAAPVETHIARGNELLTPAFVQEAQGVTDGQIAVSVRVALACGAQLDNVFFFEDPIKRCGAPELSAIAGHEAEFYACAEKWVAGGAGCGDDGYLLGYGARYAHAFYYDTRPRMSSRGKVWLDKVLVCLQQELRSAISIDASCDDIRRTAFDQHPACYAESGFCTLPLRDILRVPATVSGKDLLSRDGLRQLVGIVPACGEQYRLALETLFGKR